MANGIRVIGLGIALASFSFHAEAEDFTNAIHAYLQHRAEVEGKPWGIVIGLADEHGSTIISYGKLAEATDKEVNGDSVFALHSGTGWFTALLLQDMIDRGEMKLDDPVSKYLPGSVKVPSYQGRAIAYHKISDQPAPMTEPLKPWVAIKLDSTLLDACVGRYEIPPDALSPTGAKLVISREGDHLVGQMWGENTTRGAMDIYPASETNFFIKLDGSQLTFVKDDKGEVTQVIHHLAGIPDHKGRKASGPAD